MAIKPNATVFHLLDLDRTLFDTTTVMRTFQQIIAKHNPRLAEDVKDELQVYTIEHRSFFPFKYVHEKVGPEALRMYIHELGHVLKPEDLLLPGALERIAFGKSQPGWGVGILTYGSVQDQKIKLKLSGLQLERHLIVDSMQKGKLIASWVQPDGRFKLPIEFGGHSVDMVILDDDKLVAFNDLPKQALGQWVTHASIGGAHELPKLAENVQVVPNLVASVAYLKTKLLDT